MWLCHTCALIICEHEKQKSIEMSFRLADVNVIELTNWLTDYTRLWGWWWWTFQNDNLKWMSVEMNEKKWLTNYALTWSLLLLLLLLFCARKSHSNRSSIDFLHLRFIGWLHLDRASDRTWIRCSNWCSCHIGRRSSHSSTGRRRWRTMADAGTTYQSDACIVGAGCRRYDFIGRSTWSGHSTQSTHSLQWKFNLRKSLSTHPSRWATPLIS